MILDQVFLDRQEEIKELHGWYTKADPSEDRRRLGERLKTLILDQERLIQEALGTVGMGPRLLYRRPKDPVTAMYERLTGTVASLHWVERIQEKRKGRV